MAKAYYSTVFEQPAAEVWKIVRDFNNYPVWAGGAGESRIEDGKAGDAVGAIRSVLYQGQRIRQRLLAQSDVDRSQTYEFCGPPSLPMTDFRCVPPWPGRSGSPRNTRKPGVSGHIGGFRTDLASDGLARAARRLLHSRAAFGIALPVAGARVGNLSDAGVAQW